MRVPVMGRDVVISAWKGDNYYPFCAAEEVMLTMISEIIDSTTGNSGAWNYFDYSGKNNWNASLKGTTILQDAVDTLWFSWELFLLSVRSQKLDLKITFTDVNGNVKYCSGQGLIPESSIRGMADEFSDYDFKITGSGPLDMNGFLLLPNGDTVMRIQWMTNDTLGVNKVQDNRLIGKSAADILLVSLEGDDKFFVITTGDPTDRQVRLDNTEGSLRFMNDFDAGMHIICLLKD